MTECETQSFEELILEDYIAKNKGKSQHNVTNQTCASPITVIGPSLLGSYMMSEDKTPLQLKHGNIKKYYSRFALDKNKFHS